MKLTVCISSYKNMPYLKKLIDCFDFKSYYEVEFLLYDDFSNDEDTELFLKGLNYKNLKIINADFKSGNPGFGRNELIKIAKGEFILFIDGDDLFIGDMKMLLKELNLCDDYDVILSYPKYVLADESLVDCDVKFAKELYTVSKETFKHFAKHYAIHQTGIWNIYRTKYLNQKELFFPTEFRSEDHLFVHLVLNENPRIGRVTQRYYGWRLHQGSHSISGSVLENNLLFSKEAIKLYSKIDSPEIKDEVAYNLFNTLLSNLVRGYPKTTYTKRRKYFKEIKKSLKVISYQGDFQGTDVYFRVWYKYNLDSFFICNGLYLIYKYKRYLTYSKV